MTLADARALMPHLALAPEAPDADMETLRRLADWCTRYTPSCAIGSEDQCGGAGLWLDIAGCAHLFGGEAALIADLTDRMRRLGFTARAAIADTHGAAWAWARFATVDAAIDAIIPPGQQRKALAALPVTGLRIGAEAVAALHRVGLRRIGDLYAFPRASLPVRFGGLLLQRIDQALGGVAEPMSPRPPPVIIAQR